MKKISILDLPEDLLNDDQSLQSSASQKPKSENLCVQANPSKPQLKRLDCITDAAQALEVCQEELRDWAQEAALPENVLKTILKIAQRLKLNPLMGHLDWELNLEGDYELFIPIDGWIALIHREPTFQGLGFDQATETENGIPLWMECTIYRSNLAHPITVREYFAELKTDHPLWQQMPRRMLRHKTVQQCARLAFGITVPELKRSLAQPIEDINTISRKGSSPLNQKVLLKQKLTSAIPALINIPNAP